MSLPKVIPKPVFQAIAGVALLGAAALTAYWAATRRGLFLRVALLLADPRGEFDVVAAAGLTFLALLVAILPPLFLLRAFSRMPSLKEQLAEARDDPLLGRLFRAATPASTPERDLASAGARAAALAIDRAVAVLAMVIGILPGVALEAAEIAPKGAGVAVAMALAAPGLFYAYARDARRGQSLGRRLLGQRVVDATTRAPIGAWRSFKRELPLHLAPTLAIELLLLFLSRDRRRLGDLWAGTVVVRDPAGTD